jgi:hypothetical protein
MQAHQEKRTPNLKFLSKEHSKKKAIEEAERRKGDHTLLVEAESEVKIGICEINGNSPKRHQEDAYITDASPASTNFMQLSPEERERVAKATFSTLQSQVKNKKDGSSACVATAQVVEEKDSQERKVVVSTSYTGDSIAVLVIIHANGTYTSIPCNPQLHDEYNNEECAAVELGYGSRVKGIISSAPSTAGRLEFRGEGILAMTRALGDSIFDGSGISHVPQTTEIAYKLQEGYKSVETYANEVGKLVAASCTEGAESIAETIVDYALARGSTDNVTSMVVPLEAAKPAVTVGVFDGHGSAEVSQALGEAYLTVFNDMVSNMREEGQPKIVAAEDEAKHSLTSLQTRYHWLCASEDLTQEKVKERAEVLFYGAPWKVIENFLRSLYDQSGISSNDKDKLMGFNIKKLFNLNERVQDFLEKYKYVHDAEPAQGLEPCKQQFDKVYNELQKLERLIKESLDAKQSKASKIKKGKVSPEVPLSSADEAIDNVEKFFLESKKREAGFTTKTTGSPRKWMGVTVGGVSGAAGGAVGGFFLGAADQLCQGWEQLWEPLLDPSYVV